MSNTIVNIGVSLRLHETVSSRPKNYSKRMKNLKKDCLAIFLPLWGACGGSDDSSCCWLPEAVRFSNSARSDVKFLTSEVVRQLFGGNGGDRTKVRPAAVEAAEAGWTGSGAYVKPVKKEMFLFAFIL